MVTSKKFYTKERYSYPLRGIELKIQKGREDEGPFHLILFTPIFKIGEKKIRDQEKRFPTDDGIARKSQGHIPQQNSPFPW